MKAPCDPKLSKLREVFTPNPNEGSFLAKSHDSQQEDMNWICSQIGAREHYAVPRVLHRQGKLETLYTDFWANSFWRGLGNLAGRQHLSTRYHQDLSDARVRSFNLSTVVDSSGFGRKKVNAYEWFLAVGSDFGESVMEILKRKRGADWKETIFFGYDTGFLEPARWLKSRGGKTIVCQMDPSRFEVDLLKAEEKKWPGWAKESIPVPEEYFRRREEEWKVADIVMVNSEWTKSALIRQGVPEDKLVVVPLAFEKSVGAPITGSPGSAKPDSITEFTAKKPLRVLFLGQVILRKGIQYLIEAASMLRDEPVQFDIVGPLGISKAALESAPPTMTFHGAISRDRAPGFFGSSDLFVLPTISDGFALTQIEAMAHGLPVIATPNCGDVVTSGVDGLIVPAFDGKALAEAILSLVRDPEKLMAMSAATAVTIEKFSHSKLGDHLIALEGRLSAH